MFAGVACLRDLAAMNDKNQLDWAKWSPYLAGTEAWTTYLLPGLGEHAHRGRSVDR